MRLLCFSVWALALAGLAAELFAVATAWALYRACFELLACVVGWIR